METQPPLNPLPLTHPSYRPYQDPSTESTAPVDLSKYPEPKDSTTKIRGTSELLDTIVGGMEPELLTAKGFYFFFYAAFGSLFPLLGVYFKQLGLNGAQAGVLSGIRPLVEYLAAPFWVGWAERNNRLKTVLLCSCFCWILFTFPLGSLQPEPVGCLAKLNNTHIKVIVPEPAGVQFSARRRRFVQGDEESSNLIIEEDSDDLDSSIYTEDPPSPRTKRQSSSPEEEPTTTPRRKALLSGTPPKPGISPLRIAAVAYNYDKDKMANWVSPSFSSQVFKKDDVTKVFFLLLMLVIFGEATASPAIVIADSAVLGFLGDEAGRRYGHQRMFGSCGWAIAMFFIGIALDHSTFPLRKCEPMVQEKNYTVCFAIFVVMMGIASLLAWRLKMPEITPQSLELASQNNPQIPGFEDVSMLDEKPPVSQDQSAIPHSTVFAQQNKKIPEWMAVFNHFKTMPNCMAFLFIAWLMGIGIGLIFTFLFWHLQDFGGTPTLFGLASVINHVSEIFAYFFSSQFITQLGHVKVLCVGLLCNVLRFLYISVLKNPWWVLPFEFVQGITHAACWAACSSYLAHHTPPELRAPAQSVLQGLHHGLGRGCGAVIGGIMVANMGTKGTFSLYGIVCALCLGAFWGMNFYRKDTNTFLTSLPEEQDPHNVVEGDGAHLAPHGVPGGQAGMTRVHSASRLPQMQGQEFGQQQGQQQGQGDYYNQQPAQYQQPAQQPTNPFAQQQYDNGFNR